MVFHSKERKYINLFFKRIHRKNLASLEQIIFTSPVLIKRNEKLKELAK